MPKSLKLKKQHQPLLADIQKDNFVEKIKTPKQKPELKNSEFLDNKISQKILKLARLQQDELEPTADAPIPKSYAKNMPKISKLDSEDSEDDEFKVYDEMQVYDEFDIDEQDASLIEKFMTKEPGQKLNLSEMILGKIKESDDAHMDSAPEELNPKIVEVYTKVGSILSRYKSGPIPKAFKIIPSLKNWEEILFLTQPAQWTTQAVFQATKIFVSNLKEKMAQRFFTLILLDRVRDDIAETKKLDYHLYMALKKGLYKPAAFFKGLLFPLCEGGNCTLREAAIVGSVLTKVSVPVLHSAAALLKISDMEYTGSNSLFIRILLDKKYALPFKVVDALVFHFIRFKQDQREMPVLWHQAFLVFCQRYKADLTPEQKDALLDLVKFKTHVTISAEIRRELVNSTCRGDIIVDEMEF